jgi:hypothetical protein
MDKEVLMLLALALTLKSEGKKSQMEWRLVPEKAVTISHELTKRNGGGGGGQLRTVYIIVS